MQPAMVIVFPLEPENYQEGGVGDQGVAAEFDRDEMNDGQQAGTPVF